MRLLVLYLLASMPTPSWAAASLASNTHGMDASITYLHMIFGVMDGVLHGTGSQIAGHLSAVLSTVILCVVSVLWTYTTFVSILNTASEGQFLGQKWSSMWVPVRTLVGFCLLIPKGTTGYSLIQVIVMSIVVQGVGAANLCWKKTLSYLEAGGTIVETFKVFPSQTLNAENKLHQSYDEHWAHNHLIGIAGDILKSEVYMMTLQYMRDQKSSSSVLMPPVNFARTLNLSGYEDRQSTQRTISFSVGSLGSCGSISWLPSVHEKRTAGLPYALPSSDLYQAAVQCMILNLLPSAERIARKIISEPSEEERNVEANKQPNSTPILQPNVPLPSYDDKGTTFTQGENYSLVKAAQSAMGMLKIDFINKNRKEKENYKKLFEEDKKFMEQAGWITAGIYYWTLASMNKYNRELDSDWREITKRITTIVEEKDLIRAQLSKGRQQENLDRCAEEFKKTFIQAEKDRSTKYYQAPWITDPSQAHSTESAQPKLREQFTAKSRWVQMRMQTVLNEKTDPIVALSTIGRELLAAVGMLWEETYRDKIEIGGLVNFAALMPIVSIWMLLNFAIGSVLVYYLPLIPFLLFLFGSLTWLGLVIGAILAAPLVAFGIMHPEGHDFFGQAEQAVKLLAALFLRPMLMILGLIFGMILCTVAFELFHYGYRIAMQTMLQDVRYDGVLTGVSQIATTTIYTTVSLSLVSRCFSLIYEVPNRVFSWIGWHTEGHSEGDILNQVKGSIDQHMGSIGSQVSSRPTGSAHNQPTGRPGVGIGP